MLLRGFALPFVDNVRAALGDITAQASFRHMTTPWGAAMSVAMTNCGDAGWLTDREGYRRKLTHDNAAALYGLG